MEYLKAIKQKAETELDKMTGTDNERKVKMATSAENWPTPQSQLYEIAQATFDYSGYREVVPLVWRRMHESTQWRVVYKCLVLLEQLLKHGSERVISETMDRGYELKQFADYHCMEGDKDRGAGIRDKAKEIMELLRDTERLKAEREKAAALRGKYVGVSNSGSSTSYDNGASPRGGYGGNSGFGSASGGYGNNNNGGGGYGGYDNGGYGGSNNAYGSSQPQEAEDAEVKKDKKKKKKKKKEAVEEEEAPAPASGNEESEEEVVEKKKKKKDKKEKKDKKKKKHADEEAAPAEAGFDAGFGGNDSNSFAAFGGGAAASNTNDFSFDAGFGGSSSGGNDFGSSFGGNAAPRAAASDFSSSWDSFDGASAAPAQSSGGFDVFGSAPAPQAQSNDLFFGSSGASSSSANVGGDDLLELMQSATPAPAPQKVTGKFTGRPGGDKPAAAQPAQRAPTGNDAWQTGLVDLNLGGNQAKPAQAPSQGPVMTKRHNSSNPFDGLGLPGDNNASRPALGGNAFGAAPMGGMGMQGGFGAPMGGMPMGRPGMGGMGMQGGFGAPMGGMGMQGGFGAPMGGMGMQGGFGAPQMGFGAPMQQQRPPQNKPAADMNIFF